MLSTDQRAIVTATVPLLESGGEALVTHFYQTLFKDYPEVVPYFNQANQTAGAQQRALANGILAYARNINNLERLGPLVDTIINKHVALQILPEHYPLVGASLLKAIREVLGADVATDSVIDAWAAAYGQLADILVRGEKAIYAAQAGAAGGWSGPRAFIVEKKTPESAEITSFTFVAADGGPVMAHEPGQYISVGARPNGESIRRQYSLSAAANGKTYRISVKREPQGKMSSYLHDVVQEGDQLQLLPPAGAFVLSKTDKPLVLISGGVGLTPTLAMLESALETGREIRFIHSARDVNVHAFRKHIDALAKRHSNFKRFYCYNQHHAPTDRPDAVGFIDKALLESWLPQSRDIDAYFLGPTGFMQSVKRSLRELGVPENQTHYEFFGPAALLD
ncbi:NO-inducible flavohemoprotein [Massilia glaciei]|uniref:nitric oxide dioxygenase n=1 Tax=Massilia glaciei TaxID=1524097 RepID=A0A2U2HGI6_9BURK|nr:NO-inducible flavohemoprotein [Massilia glaciei]PWF44039.1 NO-inducible flavohemoprotein [Massilia glaciei]